MTNAQLERKLVALETVIAYGGEHSAHDALEQLVAIATGKAQRARNPEQAARWQARIAAARLMR